MSPASRIHGVIQANLACLLVAAVRALPVPLQVITEGQLSCCPTAAMSGCPIWLWRLMRTSVVTRPSRTRSSS